MQNVSPKIFISYAGEDKPFVADLATKLRGQGVNVWVAFWEILPGDSLVRKIFDEGLKGARDAVIVVLSQHSVNKPWVREELGIAVVKRINEGIKLIPVVIDDCEIPYALLSTQWIRIPNLSNYEAELNKIVGSIYGHYDRPPLGKPPAYVQTIIDTVPGLTKTDSHVLKLAGDEAVKVGQLLLATSALLVQAQSLGIATGVFYEALDALEVAGYLRAERSESPIDPIFLIEITINGFEAYAKTYVPRYDDVFRSLVAHLVNMDMRDSQLIADATGQSPLVVVHVFDVLAQRKLVQVAKHEGGASVYDVSSQLKRLLR